MRVKAKSKIASLVIIAVALALLGKCGGKSVEETISVEPRIGHNIKELPASIDKPVPVLDSSSATKPIDKDDIKISFVGEATMTKSAMAVEKVEKVEEVAPSVKKASGSEVRTSQNSVFEVFNTAPPGFSESSQRFFGVYFAGEKLGIASISFLDNGGFLATSPKNLKEMMAKSGYIKEAGLELYYGIFSSPLSYQSEYYQISLDENKLKLTVPSSYLNESKKNRVTNTYNTKSKKASIVGNYAFSSIESNNKTENDLIYDAIVRANNYGMETSGYNSNARGDEVHELKLFWEGSKNNLAAGKIITKNNAYIADRESLLGVEFYDQKRSSGKSEYNITTIFDEASEYEIKSNGRVIQRGFHDAGVRTIVVKNLGYGKNDIELVKKYKSGYISENFSQYHLSGNYDFSTYYMFAGSNSHGDPYFTYSHIFQPIDSLRILNTISYEDGETYYSPEIHAKYGNFSLFADVRTNSYFEDNTFAIEWNDEDHIVRGSYNTSENSEYPDTKKWFSVEAGGKLFDSYRYSVSLRENTEDERLGDSFSALFTKLDRLDSGVLRSGLYVRHIDGRDEMGITFNYAFGGRSHGNVGVDFSNDDITSSAIFNHSGKDGSRTLLNIPDISEESAILSHSNSNRYANYGAWTGLNSPQHRNRGFNVDGQIYSNLSSVSVSGLKKSSVIILEPIDSCNGELIEIYLSNNLYDVFSCGASAHIPVRSENYTKLSLVSKSPSLDVTSDESVFYLPEGSVYTVGYQAHKVINLFASYKNLKGEALSNVRVKTEKNNYYTDENGFAAIIIGKEEKTLLIDDKLVCKLPILDDNKKVNYVEKIICE